MLWFHALVLLFHGHPTPMHVATCTGKAAAGLITFPRMHVTCPFRHLESTCTHLSPIAGFAPCTFHCSGSVPFPHLCREASFTSPEGRSTAERGKGIQRKPSPAPPRPNPNPSPSQQLSSKPWRTPAGGPRASAARYAAHSQLPPRALTARDTTAPTPGAAPPSPRPRRPALAPSIAPPPPPAGSASASSTAAGSSPPVGSPPSTPTPPWAHCRKSPTPCRSPPWSPSRSRSGQIRSRRTGLWRRRIRMRRIGRASGRAARS